MNQDERFAAIEARLRRDAEQLSRQPNPDISAERLWGEHRRRVRRRRLSLTLVATTAILAVASAVGGLSNLRRPQAGTAQVAENAPPQPPRLAVDSEIPPILIAILGEGEPGAGSVLFLVVDANQVGDETIPAAILVPQQRQPVEIDQLSPIEQQAIWRALEADQQNNQERTI